MLEMKIHGQSDIPEEINMDTTLLPLLKKKKKNAIRTKQNLGFKKINKCVVSITGQAL